MYIFQYQLNWSNGNFNKFKEMERNVQAKTKLLLFISQEMHILWTQIRLQAQSTSQCGYRMQLVYIVLNREAVGIRLFTEYTDNKQGVEWTSLEKQSPWHMS